MSIERTIQPNDYEYFLMQKINRYNFICNLLSQYHTNEIKNMNFISIGCGLGGEESWVTEKFKKEEKARIEKELKASKKKQKIQKKEVKKVNVKLDKKDTSGIVPDSSEDS